MVLDSLREGQIDITGLTIEAPEQPTEPDFDPERQITESDWEVMLRELRVAHNTQITLLRAACMKLVLPEHTKAMEHFPNMPDPIEADASLQLLGARGKWDDFMEMAVNAKITDFKLFQQLDIRDKLREYIFSYMKSYGNNTAKAEGDTNILSLLANFKILFPGKPLPYEEDEIWPSLKEEMRDLYNFGKYIGFLKNLSKIKILYPEKVDELYSPEDLLALEAVMISSDEDWGMWLFENRLMKIVRAKEIRITDKSFELIMTDRPKIESDQAEMPVIREF
jgi:hypothetical protein